MTISDGFKKLTLATIGAGVITYEKLQRYLDTLLKKERLLLIRERLSTPNSNIM